MNFQKTKLGPLRNISVIKQNRTELKGTVLLTRTELNLKEQYY